MRRGAAIAVLAIAVAVLPASAAHARDAIVDSFDGEPIVTHFFPAKGLGAGQRAPTILMGSGWGVPRGTAGGQGGLRGA